MLLVVLLIPCLIFVACNDDDEKEDCSEGHTWKNAKNPKRHKLIQSRTCTLPEIRERECKVCGTKEKYESLKPAGSLWDAEVYLNDATCYSNGHYARYCYWYDQCGHEDREKEEPNTKLEHDYRNFVPKPGDPTIGVGKCLHCDATKEELIMIKLDMEGDRSHLGYQKLFVSTETATNAQNAQYKTVGSNTYLSITREDKVYVGSTDFGVTVKPDSYTCEYITDGETYVFEATLMLENAGSNIVIVGEKAYRGQKMQFVKYNYTAGNLEVAGGDVIYTLTAQDKTDGIRVSVVVNDDEQWYRVYVNNVLVSGSIAFVGGYFAGFPLNSIRVYATGSGATEFGIDNIGLYKASDPDGYTGAGNADYAVHEFSNGEKVSYKLLDDECTSAHSTMVVKKTVAKTCTTYGYTVKECSECHGQEITDVVAPPAGGHSYGTPEVSPASCYEGAYAVYTCTVCEAKKGEQTAPAKGHIHGSDAEVSEATCTSNRITKGDCVVCGEYFVNEALGTQTAHEIDTDVTVVLPTCSTDGYTTGFCKHCRTAMVDPNGDVGAYGHYYIEIDKHVEPDCAHGGYDEYTCLSCGEKQRTNEVGSKNHQYYYKVKTETIGNATTYNCTYYCTRCPYSYSFSDTGDLTDYYANYIKGDKYTSVRSLYQDSEKAKSALFANTLNPYNKMSYFVNGENNSYARFVRDSVAKNDTLKYGDDAYFDFSLQSNNGNMSHKPSNGNVVWEFDVKFPESGATYEGNALKNGGVIMTVNTDASNDLPNSGNALSPIKIYPDGTIAVNNMKDGHGGGYGAFLKWNYKGATTYTTEYDTEVQGVKVSSETWTKIAILLNNEERKVVCYVNGERVATLSVPDNYLKKVRWLRFNAMYTGEFTAVDFRNMNCYIADTPAYQKAPDPLVDYMNTNLKADVGSTDINDIFGSLAIDKKSGLAVSCDQDFTYAYTKSDTSVAGSMIYGDVSKISANSFTVRTNATLANSSGDYSLVGLKGDKGTLPIVYVKDGKIQVAGSSYTKSVGISTAVKVDVVVKSYSVEEGEGEGKTEKTYHNYDVYIDGIVAAEDVSMQAIGTASQLEMFKINEGSESISLKIHDILVYEKAVIPDYYVGFAKDYTADGSKNNIVGFDGTEKIADILPANTPLAGGYYYTDIEKSYLSLAKKPGDYTPVANIRYDKLSGNGALGADNGFNVLVVENFKAHGAPTLKFTNFPTLAYDSVNGVYDISDYTKMTLKFFANDTTAGYIFKVFVDGKSTSKEVFSGKSENRWNAVEIDLKDAPKEIVAIRIVFDEDGCGVSGEVVDGFTFALIGIDLTAPDKLLENTEYIYKPHKTCAQHTYGTEVSYPKNPTCSNYQYKVKECTECGYKDVTVVKTPGHTFEEAAAGGQAATCETDGYKYLGCKDCDKQTKVVLPKLGHNFVLDEHATASDGKKAATCTESGIDIYVCDNDNCELKDKKFGMVTDALGHTPAEGATVTSDPDHPDDCEDIGKETVSKCARCEQSYTRDVDNVKHNYVDVVEEVTCTKDGKTYKKCTVCGEKKDEVVTEAHGHTKPASYLITRVETSCTSASGWKYTCLGCGEKVIEEDVGAVAAPHAWGEWEVITPATCGTNGHRDKECATCGGYISNLGTLAEKADCILPAEGQHDFSGNYITSDDWNPGIRGEKWKECKTCHQIGCLEGAGTEGLVYTYNNNGAYIVTGYNGTATELVIPAYFKGCPVIVGRGFAGTKAATITKVTMADGSLLAEGAFEGFTELAEIKLSSAITVIPQDAFSGCAKLVRIELPANCTEIRTGAFYGCTSLEEITINGELTKVQTMAFAGCDKLAKVNYVSDEMPDIGIVIEKIGNEKFTSAEWAKKA